MDYEATVRETMEMWSRLTSDMITVRPERCVRVRNRHASCRRCADACTAGAISDDAGNVLIDADACVGCGTCATVCPTGALEVHYPNDASLISAARKTAAASDGAVAFACQPAMQGIDDDAAQRCVSVVCLSRIDEALVVGLFADGVREVTALHAECAACPRSCAWMSIQLVKETLGTLMRAWNIPAVYRVMEIPSGKVRYGFVAAAHSNAARRTAVGNEESNEREKCPIAHVTYDGTLPHFVPEKRAKLLDALSKFGNPVTDEIDTRLWGHITINRDICQSCRMCAVFCPTGALCKFADDDGSMGIEHYTAECVHCCLCQDICPVHAIASVTQVSATELMDGAIECYEMDEPSWKSGPDQILRRMETKIGGREVAASYGI